MPWKASSVMEERLRFVARLLDGEAMTEVCREFGISRKTGYKIFDRYKEHGLEALSDRSKRPIRYANQLPAQIETLIVQLKAEKPHWGARKIRELLVRRLDGDVRVVDRDVFPAMRGVGRHVVIHHLAGAEIVEIVLGIVIFGQLVDRDHVERAVLEGEPGRHVQPFEDRLDLAFSPIVLDGVDIAETEGAKEPTNSVPLSPQAICRAASTPGAQTSILKPGGSLIFFTSAASSASNAPVGGPDGGARPFCCSVSSPRNQSSGGWVQNSLVPDS